VAWLSLSVSVADYHPAVRGARKIDLFRPQLPRQYRLLTERDRRLGAFLLGDGGGYLQGWSRHGNFPGENKRRHRAMLDEWRGRNGGRPGSQGENRGRPLHPTYSREEMARGCGSGLPRLYSQCRPQRYRFRCQSPGLVPNRAVKGNFHGEKSGSGQPESRERAVSECPLEFSRGKYRRPGRRRTGRTRPDKGWSLPNPLGAGT
jgi:hypothetical protein